MPTEAEPKTHPTYTTRATCRACHQPKLQNVLSLGDQFLINFTREKDPNLPRAPLNLVRCDSCGLLQLKETVNRDLLWLEYWYRSGVNATMREALADVVRHGLTFHSEGAWLDIGANDGTLLSKVPREFRKVACEPALNFVPLLEEHADTVVSDFFNAEKIPGPFQVITSCACFYDSDAPDVWVQDVASLLTNDGIWINQVSDTPKMLLNNGFDNICHEHVAHWDVWSLKSLYEKYGLSIVSVSHNDVNGGSLRVIAAKNRTMTDLGGIRRVTDAAVMAFARRVKKWKTLMTELIYEMPGICAEPLWGLGASTKGSVMLQYLDCSDRFVGIGDRNPAKHGTVMAGTWIPIVDESTMRMAKAKYVVPFIWAFRDELMAREALLRANGATLLFPLPNPEFVL